MYLKKKCSACGYWTVFELSIFCRHANETCTHCGYSLKNLPWDRDARKAFEESRASFEGLCEKYPRFRDLKEPGDHVRIEEE